ncbi:hypothetical protein EU96_1568 [Prochlorococcus marinus str. MIT 9302]|uniref:Uncharacterized protein n=1 Tax=Prochlorococcus marinus str. MIT 9302 TaxID=74545 RepID=A0A0A2A8V2_PROMR|nr:hypothetical protein EU96_1568 [Prochlorococcus marinus str. MIT 9302]
MYINSFIFSILTIISSFFFLYKRFAKFNLKIYAILYSLAAFLRPYSLEAIDNENLAKYLTSKSFWGGTENYTYQLVYYLVRPFEDYKIKFFVLIFLSLILIAIGTSRLISFFRNSSEHKNKWNLYTFLILIYLPSISSVLFQIHLRQFFSFSIVIFLISFLIKPSKYNIFIIPICGILVSLAHPIYLILIVSFIPFYLNYVFSIKQINSFFRFIFSILYRYRFVILWPFLFGLFFLGNQLYLNIFSLLPILKAYSYFRDIEIQSNNTFIIPIFLLLINHFISVTFYYKYALRNAYIPIKNFSLRPVYTYSLILITFVLIIISLEIFAPSIYSVGRIKSAIYPSLFITIPLLGYAKKRSILFFSTFSLVICSLSIFYSFLNRLKITF